MNIPKRGGHKKPTTAARHAPTGYEHQKPCPTCGGSGKVAKEDSLHARALRRA